jgi:TonB family protein
MFGWSETSLFAILVGVALKSTIVLGAAWVAAFALRSRSAAVRHLVWTAAAAALLALPLLSISLPSLSVPVASETSVLFRTTAMARSEAPVSQPLPQVPAAPSHSIPRRLHWRFSIILLWAAGSLLAFVQMLLALARMRRVRRSALPSAYSHTIAELAQAVGIHHSVDVLDAPSGAMPMTFGILRPAVFLPRDASDWSDERRRVVLLHELAHVRRGDVPLQLMARLALILHWWNPLAWTAWRAFLAERERAADDLVLRTDTCASDYARHLLEIARVMQSGPALGWAAVAMARRSQLEGRLLAILDSRTNRKPAGRSSALAAALVPIALIAPLAAIRAQGPLSSAIPADVDATIRAAVAQKNSEMVEKPAAAFEVLRQYDASRRLLDSAAAIHEQVSGARSEDYGRALLKLGDLERKRYRASEAESFYTEAVAVLGDRAETAPALMYLGVLALGHKNSTVAMDDFRKAQTLDPSLAGQARMWTAQADERDGNATDAEAMYRSALAVENPTSNDHTNTTLLFGRFLENHGRADEAKALGNPLPDVPTPPPGPNVFRVKDGATPPKVLTKIDPIYPVEAKTAGYSATVRVQMEVGTDGTPHNIHVARSAGLGLDDSAAAAISQWRFVPGTKDGAPASVLASIEVNFHLQ